MPGEEVAETIVETVDLTPILESLARLEELHQFQVAAQFALCGIVLAAAVVLILAVMFR